MPTVTYLGDDSNMAVLTWCNSITGESIKFPINQAVNVDPDAPENANRQPLVRHIVKKLASIRSPHFRLDDEAPKIDGRTKEARAAKAQETA